MGTLVRQVSDISKNPTANAMRRFLNKAKPKQHRDKVLMLDARGVYRKVTRKIYDCSTERLANLTSIVSRYRGEMDRFIGLLVDHLSSAVSAYPPTLRLIAHHRRR